jgi:hypothetical protein
MTSRRPKTRFLPIRSKSQTLNKYEEMRHPSSYRFTDIRQLYQYIKSEPGIFLKAAPSIFFTNKSYTEPPFDHIGMISAVPHVISFHEEFIDRIDEEKPFIATMCLQLYNESFTHIIEYHMMPFIFFPALNQIHLLDTVNRPAEFNNAIAIAINKSLNMNIIFVDIPSSLALHYETTINLQEDEIEGYCTCWTAGMIEKIAPHVNQLEKMTWSEQFDFYTDLYDILIENPSFGRDFYNILAMRSQGSSRNTFRRVE